MDHSSAKSAVCLLQSAERDCEERRGEQTEAAQQGVVNKTGVLRLSEEDCVGEIFKRTAAFLDSDIP